MKKIALMTIDLRTYADGRGFTFSQMLRKLYECNSELRAMRRVVVDIILRLARCGLDSSLIKAGHDAKLALEAFETFTVDHQRFYLRQ